MSEKSQAFAEGKAIGTASAAGLIEQAGAMTSECFKILSRGAIAEMEDRLRERAAIGWNEADLQEFERGIVAGFGEKSKQYCNSAVTLSPATAGLH